MVVTVGICDCQVSNWLDAELVTHALGSCVAVAVHDPVARVAGLLHILLPDSAIDRAKGQTDPFTFADTGIPKLLQRVCDMGGEKRRLRVMLVGGAQVLDPNGVFNIGKRNHQACRKTLWAAGVMVHGEEVGGTISRTVRMEVATGKLLWSTGGGAPQELRAGGKNRWPIEY